MNNNKILRKIMEKRKLGNYHFLRSKNFFCLYYNKEFFRYEKLININYIDLCAFIIENGKCI